MIIQGSSEWHAARLGKVTASRVADVIARTKTGHAASRNNYLAELVTERLTGVAAEGYTNAAMQWGLDQEADARIAYEFYTNSTVSAASFVPHSSIADTGASPDGYVGTDGLVEIKCPQTATHIATLDGVPIPAKYITQMLWQMACTGRLWCDFVSYDPRMPEAMRLHIERVKRDDDRIAELEAEVVRFLTEVRETVERLLSRYDPQPEAELDEPARMLMAG